MIYYNEWERYPAQWLRNLGEADIIQNGFVDERSIVDVKADELKQYKQCHFFAGIGGWAYALRLAGWPDDKPVWSASLPCQPFSTAGKQKGDKDERHLWPVFYELVKANRPFTIFGEQVPNAIKLGWLDGVFADLEKEGYTCGAVVLPACSIGAPHIRQRIFWVAESKEAERERARHTRPGRARLADDSRLANNNNRRPAGHGEESDTREEVRVRTSVESGNSSEVGGVAKPERNAEGSACREGNSEWFDKKPNNWNEVRNDIANSGQYSRMGNTELHGCNGIEKLGGTQEEGRLLQPERPSPWSNYIFIPCADGKARRIKFSPLSMADGLSEGMERISPEGAIISPLTFGEENRANKIKGYGNAIVAEVAAIFIKAFLEDNAA